MTDKYDHLVVQSEKVRYPNSLIGKCIRRLIDPVEQDKLEAWIDAEEEHAHIIEKAADWDTIRNGLEFLTETSTQRALLRIKSRIRFDKSPRMYSQWQYVAAASLLVMASLTIFYAVRKTGKTFSATERAGQLAAPLIGNNSNTFALTGEPVSIQQMLGPGTRSERVIDNINDDPGARLSLVASSDSVYSTVTTPADSGSTLVLSDGTRIWLNPASSVTYPVEFTADERRVSVVGDVYFEVAKNENKPFMVEVKDRDMVVEVLGTHFSVNSLTDGPLMRSTCPEGTIKISSFKKETF
jgi:transmembrane sensor